MSTIRPLATIAALAALGVFLAVEINKAPTVATNDSDWATPTDDASEAPSFEAASVTARTAPDWADVKAAPTPADPPKATPPAMAPTPAFPALPKLPPMDNPAIDAPAPIQGAPAGTTIASEPASSPAFPNSLDQKLTPPASIPQANYGAAPSATNPPQGISGNVPSLGSTTSAYGVRQPEPTGAPGFDAAWQAVEMALERDELTRAHRMLSQWRDEPKLSNEQRQRVDPLLAQLAGTVVYSTEHRLEPPRIVAPGETLVTVADEYQVPWQLLAKINGVASPEAVQPGQSLKVIRGPFTAEVNLARGEIVVLLDDRYAGRFPVRVEGAAPADGAWRVGQKRIDETRQPMAGAAVPSAVATSVTPKVVLESPSGEQIDLSSGPTPPAGARGRLTIASNDLADLYDILSIGSQVTVRR